MRLHPVRTVMDHVHGTFDGAGGLALFWQGWLPDEPPRTVVLIVHGVGEHSGRYPNLVAGLVPRGHGVYGFDHRGHGRSPGRRGHVDSWREYRGDVDAFVRMIAARQPGRRVVVFAHSMGALIALDYLPTGQALLAGAIISGAPIAPVGVGAPVLVAIAKALSRLWPTFVLRSRLDVEAISRDPDVVRAYREDPLVHGVVTARWGTEALDAVRRVRNRAEVITLPVLFVHGGADRLNAAAGLGPFVDRVASADKTLRIYPGSFHEPHNDLDHRTVVADIVAWLER